MRDTRSLFGGPETANPFAITADEDLFRLQVGQLAAYLQGFMQQRLAAATAAAAATAVNYCSAGLSVCFQAQLAL